MAMPPADGMAPQPFSLVLGLFWTPYADWIYTVVSISGLLLIVWLVLRPPRPPAPQPGWGQPPRGPGRSAHRPGSG